jgi:hypothetical protein
MAPEVFPDNPPPDRMPSGQGVSPGVLLVEINRIMTPLFFRGGWITFPWVRQKVALGADYLRRSKKIRKDSGRIVRKYGHRFEVCRDGLSLKKFYHEMYVPYIRARYTRNAHLRSLGEIRAAARTGFLLKVFQGGRWISAAVCGLKCSELSWVALGMLPDYDENRRHGALSATYYFLLGWALRHGIETVDLLRSRPHGDDGVFRHKKAWGADTFLDSWPHSRISIILPDGCHLPACMKRLLVLKNSAFKELGDLWAQ